MFCENCGKKIPDVAQFCPECGAKIKPVPEEPIQSRTEYDDDGIRPGDEHAVETPEAPEKKRRRIWIPIVIVAAAVVAVFAVLLGLGILGNFGSRTVDLDEYVSVYFDGNDGYGDADVAFDLSAFAGEYDGEVRLSGEAREAGYQNFSDVIDDLAIVTVTPASGLSNGDEVTVAWDVDMASVEPLIRGNIEIFDDAFSVEVSGLTAIETFDAFADVTVSFSGISPYAEASFDTDGGRLGADAFSLDRSDDLAIGDTVTLTIAEESAKALEEEMGLRPEEMSKAYTVEGVPCYVSSLDEIPEEDMAALETYTEEIKTDKADDWPEDVHELDGIEYVGNYLLTKNADADAEDFNILYLVYKLNVTKFGKDEKGEEDNTTFDYYWYGSYTDVEILEDGSLYVDYDSFVEPGFDTAFDITTYDYTEKDEKDQEITTSYRGFNDLESLYDEVVAPMEDSYSCDSSVPD